VWPDNERALGVFERLGSRWRFPPMGGPPFALDWLAIYPLIDRLRLSPDECDELEQALTVMERSAVKTMREFEPKPKQK
jgi:hypothetical protein